MILFIKLIQSLIKSSNLLILLISTKIESQNYKSTLISPQNFWSVLS
jgi:hypothetical protein